MCVCESVCKLRCGAYMHKQPPAVVESHPSFGLPDSVASGNVTAGRDMNSTYRSNVPRCAEGGCGAPDISWRGETGLVSRLAGSSAALACVASRHSHPLRGPSPHLRSPIHHHSRGCLADKTAEFAEFGGREKGGEGVRPFAVFLGTRPRSKRLRGRQTPHRRAIDPSAISNKPPRLT
jgi:hypothetical protein